VAAHCGSAAVATSASELLKNQKRPKQPVQPMAQGSFHARAIHEHGFCANGFIVRVFNKNVDSNKAKLTAPWALEASSR
jgi:hypothetical protein